MATLVSDRCLVVGLMAVVLMSTPAAAEKWVAGHSSSCVVACRAARSSPITTGQMGGHPFTICRTTNKGDDGRPGYNLEPRWANACYIAYGGNELNQASYDCLCH
jgi:hypothetical protein